MPPRADSASVVRPPTSGRLRAADLLDGAALLVLLLVIAMRPLITETYYSSVQPLVSMSGADLTTSATTAWFDLAIWAAAIGAALAAWLRRDGWRLTGAEVGWAVLMLAAVLSISSASNKRLAVNASVDWLTTAGMIFLLANLCRERRRVVLVLAVLIATGLASAVKCGLQARAEFRETRELYEQTKAEFWQRQGVPLTDPQVELFERRLRGAEASGFLPHSNTQAALLSLVGFAALAVSDLCRRSRHAQLLIRAGGLVLFGAILTTGSRGAIGAAALGLLLWAAAGYCEPFLRRYWRGLLVFAWAVVIAAGAGVWALGQSRGGLPGSSLEFRWQYWQITRAIIADNPWTGVGALNFDRAYLPHKPIDYPEEIKDPHNFVLSTVAQFGVLGGAGLLLALLGGSWVAARHWAEGPLAGDPLACGTGVPPVLHRRDAGATPQTAWAPFAAVVVVGFVLLRMWMMRSLWLSSDAADRAAAMFDLGSYGLVWVVAFVAIVWIAETFRDAWTPASAAAVACGCGAIAFLVHNTIDFALFYPATLTAFAAVCGVCFAGDRLPKLSSKVAAPLLAVGALVTLLLVVVPVTRTESLLADARASRSPDATIQAYQAAAAVDTLDPTPLADLATYAAKTFGGAASSRSFDQQGAGPTLLNTGIHAIEDAVLRDPESADLHRLRARLLEMRYYATGSETALLASIGAGKQALLLYPTSPERHLDLAGIYARAAARQQAPDVAAALAAEAIHEYEAALSLDEIRPGTDEPRKHSREWREDIERRIARLREIGSAQPATTTAP